MGRAAELTDVCNSQAGLYSSDPQTCLSALALSKADPRPRGSPPPSYAAVERDKDTGICHTLAGVVVGRMEAVESHGTADRSTPLAGPCDGLFEHRLPRRVANKDVETGGKIIHPVNKDGQVQMRLPGECALLVAGSPRGVGA